MTRCLRWSYYASIIWRLTLRQWLLICLQHWNVSNSIPFFICEIESYHGTPLKQVCSYCIPLKFVHDCYSNFSYQQHFVNISRDSLCYAVSKPVLFDHALKHTYKRFSKETDCIHIINIYSKWSYRSKKKATIASSHIFMQFWSIMFIC